MRHSFLAYALAFTSAIICSETFAGTRSSYTSNTMTYSGTTYNVSSTSTCPDGTAALRMYRKWWCKALTSTTTSTSTSGSTSTSTSTSTSGTTSTTTTTTTTTTPTTYNAQLSWTAPTTRADGTPLTLADLAGYEIYYTTDDPTVNVTISVPTNSTVSYTLSSLAAGNYYFAMAAIDSTGLKSALSPVAPVKLGP